LLLAGGEPTLSPVFKEALALINKYKKKGKFNKVVLTTNGIHLNKFDLTGIDHVNISRHHYDQEINEKIFGTKQVPNKKDLYSINSRVNQQGIDVNYNVVITKENEDLNLAEFVSFAKMTGYEVIMHPTGDLTRDWEAKKIILERKKND